MNLPANERDIGADWLTDALQRSGVLSRGRVSAVRAERIAEGVGLMARLSRLHVEYQGADASSPRTMIAKVPIDLQQNLEIANLYRFYERECVFYEHLSMRTPLRVPSCYGIAREGASGFVLLLEDLGKARVGDQVAGSTAQDALVAIGALAEHHAAFWNQTGDLPFLVDHHTPEFCQILEVSYAQSIGPTIAAFPEHFTPALRELAMELGSKTTAMLNRNLERPLTVCHGDFRADNLFYDLPDGTKVAVIDWQISGRGFGPSDVGYHLTQSVTSEVRRSIERPAVEAYYRALTAAGVRDYSLGELWEDYREAALFMLIYPVTICGSLDLENPRARALGEALLVRSLDAITCLKSAEKLPH
jgi:aminoglycoside/choline kinase family phosphotransferase